MLVNAQAASNYCEQASGRLYLQSIVRGAEKLDESRNHTTFNHTFDGRIPFLRQNLSEFCSASELFFDIIREDTCDRLRELLQNL